MPSCDVLVVGLGAMGSATIYHLAQAGVKVIGVDQFSPPHNRGSTHGDTRLTRQAIGEGVAYVPLVQRSHQLWRQLEEATGARLLHQTGGLIMAAASRTTGQHGTDDFVAATVEAARTHGIDHEVLDTDEVRRRFPAFRLDEPHRVYYEPGAGYVLAEQAVRAQLREARRLGATIKTGERVRTAKYAAGHVELATDRDVYLADTVVLAVGPWIGQFLEPGLANLFTVYRQVLHWYAIGESAAEFAPGRFPVFIWEFGAGADDMFYGFPAINGARGGLKVATESYARPTSPDTAQRYIGPVERGRMHARCLTGRMPWITNRSLRAAACLYTVTRDFGFVVDRHPEHRNVIIVSPCSGHGFKHSAAIGEAVAHLATQRDTGVDLTPFSLARLL